MELSTSDLIRKSLHGEWAHPDPIKMLDGVDWKTAGKKVADLPYTIWQLFHHAEYWQRLIVQGLKGHKVAWPQRLEDSWTTTPAPASEAEYQKLVAEFNNQLAEVGTMINDDVLREGFPSGEGMNKAEFLRVLMTHNSYHFGQIMVLRRLLGNV
jgi:uncharacterized damage-inducible protein DinB